MSQIKITNKTETAFMYKDFLNRALKDIMALVRAECGSLFLFDSQNKELVMNSFYNSSPLHIIGLKHHLGEGVSGKVADILAPVLVKDIDSDSRFSRNGFSHYRTKSFISIPIVCAQELLGLINVTDKANGGPFSEDDLNSAVVVAKYAALALENIIRYSDIKQEKEILAKQKLCLEKYASVGKLAAGIVHEINNPLDGIIRYTNMLLHQSGVNTVIREYLTEVKKGLGRIANITKSLLEFSHQVNSNAAETRKYIDIQELITETLDLLGSHSAFSKIKLIKQFNQRLPRIADLGLSHIIVNTLRNALDAMPAGGSLRIAAAVTDTVEIKITDTGSGIKEELKDKIFEPFFTTKDKDKGSGLGLAICNEIINRYEGKITVESAAGKGSCFTVSIPKKHLENV
jgi:two-component system NtrC family sensor kinase